MDNLLTEKKIEEIKKKKEKLNGEKEKLSITIHTNENEINDIIKKAIDNIVKDDTIILDNFKEQSLKKISEIIKNKKALIKKQEDIDTKEKEIYDKIKQYILSYIESEGIKENKVIYYYYEDISGSLNMSQSIYIYIVYISEDDNIYRYTTYNKISENGNIDVETKTDVSETDLKKTYDSIADGDIKNIEEKIKNITINIKK
jgi:hypothetical protein